MRPTAVASCIVVASGMLLSAATGGTAESRLGGIKLPPGFRIAPYAEVPNARSMTLGEKGTLFVGTRKGEVYAVLPGDTAEGTHWVVTIARNLHSPNGSLLVTDDMAGRIYRISYDGKSGVSGH